MGSWGAGELGAEDLDHLPGFLRLALRDLSVERAEGTENGGALG